MDQLPTCLLLVGNKVDLEENFKREVLSETGETFAKVIGLWVRERWVGGVPPMVVSCDYYYLIIRYIMLSSLKQVQS